MDFPIEVKSYAKPTKLKIFSGKLYSFEVENNFIENQNELFQLRFPFEKINEIISKPEAKTRLTKEVPLRSKPKLLSDEIKHFDMSNFLLNDTDPGEEMAAEQDKVADSIPVEPIPKLTLNQAVKKSLSAEQKNNERFARKIPVENKMQLFRDLLPNPAWKWKFELDNFQKQAILALEKAKSVFVAAHTSAGKTVVAEYAIAMCQSRGARVIYTSPIKALSNQKYREFKNTFGHDQVGLLTGDIKTGTNKYILVMTTEILHNMLKNDSSILRDLDVVIMDEVHYLNDEHRGHIWEQIMILLPKRIQLVMLSATVPNTMPFAQWLGQIRNTQIHVISTVTRPVPLEMFLFINTSRNAPHPYYKVMDRNSNFNITGYRNACADREAAIKKAQKKYQSNQQRGKSTNPQQLREQQQAEEREKKKKKNALNSKKKRQFNFNDTGDNNDNPKSNVRGPNYHQWIALFDALKTAVALPVIIFMFSRKGIVKTIGDFETENFLTAEEKSKVDRYFREITRSKLPNAKDRNLRQVTQLQELLGRGIGYHHSGLLPILKEVVEILFSLGFVKILFATETFSVGVNMPAKTVVFDSIYKYDAKGQRRLFPGEFTQMAGRAGRRGLDSIGMVVIMVKRDADVYPESELRTVMTGTASQLESRFKISFNMILSLYRNRQFNIQYMIRHSFIEAARLKKYDDNCLELDEIQERLRKLQAEGGLICREEGCSADELVKYYQACVSYRENRAGMASLLESLRRSELDQQILCMGRLLILDCGGTSSNKRLLLPAVLVESRFNNVSSQHDRYNLTVLTYGSARLARLPSKKLHSSTTVPPIVRPHIDSVTTLPLKELEPYLVKGVCLHEIYRICNTRFSGMKPDSLRLQWGSHYIKPHEQSWETWMNNNPEFLRTISLISDENLTEEQLIPMAYEKVLDVRNRQHRKPMLDQYLALDCPVSSPLSTYPCTSCLALPEHVQLMHEMTSLQNRQIELQHLLSDDNLTFLPDYRARVHLLKSMGYIHSDRDIIELQGRIACEIGSHEVVITELMLAGVFNRHGIHPADVAAGLSCLIFESRVGSNEDGFNTNDLSPGLRTVINHIFAVVDEFNSRLMAVDMEMDMQGCLSSTDEVRVNPGMVHAVQLWVLGSSFSDAADCTAAECGDLVRCLQRLNELARHCEAAAKVIPNFEMADLFKRTQEAIYRGIVSTPSLYVDDDVPK